MPAGDGAQEYIEISDFTPGITSAYQLGGPQPTQVPPDSAASFAQIRDTWGCYGHPSGGLHPLPKMVATITDVRTPFIPTFGEYAQDGDRIAATHVMSPVQPFAAFPRIPYTDQPDLVSIIVDSPQRQIGFPSIQSRYRIRQYRPVGAPAGVVSLATWEGVVNTAEFQSCSITQVTTGTIWDDELKEYIGYDPIPGVQPGRVGVLYNVNGEGNGVQGRVYIWPEIHFRRIGQTKTQGLTVNTGYRIEPFVSLVLQNLGAVPGYLALSHQNRYMWCKSAVDENPNISDYQAWGYTGIQLGSDMQHGSGDFWRYTPPNDLAPNGYLEGFSSPGPPPVPFTDDDLDQVYGWNIIPTRFGQATSGFGCAASMNANELLLVKQTGGGTVVRGDIVAPQVTDYPGIPSSRGAACVPAVTPLGMIYGTVDGVYAWAGSDQAQLISPQLEGWFWKPEDGTTDRNEINASHGKFAYAHPFLLCPNNWVMDSRSGSWFRLTDPSEYIWKDYNTVAAGHFYAHPGAFADNGVVAARFDPAEQQSNYSWRSQPMARTRNRSMRFREINIVAQGSGTITVTLHGIEGSPKQVQFTVDSVSPRAQFLPISLEAHDVEVEITAQGANPDTAAPILHRVSLGHQGANSVAR